MICYVADVGQKDDFEAIKRTALEIGAEAVVVDDLKQEFVEDYIFPSIKTGALYEGRYLLGTAIARPLIAKNMVDAARSFDCTTIAHGATGKGNDQIRLELACKYLMPEVTLIAPWRDLAFLSQFKSRTDLLNYAKEQGLPTIFSTKKKPYSMDSNLCIPVMKGESSKIPAHRLMKRCF